MFPQGGLLHNQVKPHEHTSMVKNLVFNLCEKILLSFITVFC